MEKLPTLVWFFFFLLNILVSIIFTTFIFESVCCCDQFSHKSLVSLLLVTVCAGQRKRSRCQLIFFIAWFCCHLKKRVVMRSIHINVLLFLPISGVCCPLYVFYSYFNVCVAIEYSFYHRAFMYFKLLTIHQFNPTHFAGREAPL